jgi:hypothetical protein
MTDVKKPNEFATAKTNVIVRVKQTPKAVYVYKSQEDLKGAIDFIKASPKASVDEKGKIVLSFGKHELKDNSVIFLSEVGKVSEIITLDQAAERFEIVAQK